MDLLSRKSSEKFLLGKKNIVVIEPHTAIRKTRPTRCPKEGKGSSGGALYFPEVLSSQPEG